MLNITIGFFSGVGVMAVLGFWIAISRQQDNW